MKRILITSIVWLATATSFAAVPDIGGAYWTTARSLYTENAEANILDGKVTKYRVDLNLTDDTAYISGLMNVASFANEDLLETYQVTGKYNPENGTVTIATPYTSEYSEIGRCARLAKIRYNGDEEYTVVLLCGHLVDSDLNLEDELVLSLDDDGTTLRPQCTMLAYCINENVENNRFLDISVTSRLRKMSDSPQLDTYVSEIDFSNYFVCVGSRPSVPLTLLNSCLSPVTYRLVCDNPEVEIADASSTIETGESDTVDITLNPSAPGTISTVVKALDKNGNILLELPLTTTVNIRPSYSKIVKEGTIDFEVLTNYPWTMEQRDGEDVAVSTNIGSNTNSVLTANVQVPAGHTALLSWEAGMESKSPNGLVTRLDGNIFSSELTSSTTGYKDLSDATILRPGRHVLEFDNSILLDWYNDYGYIDTPLRSYVKALRFDTKADTPSRVEIPVRTLDFGTLYQDVYPTVAQLPLSVFNLGTSPLEITGFSGSSIFSGRSEDGRIAPLSQGTVSITLDAESRGDFNDEVTIKTSAGDLRVSCHANLIPLPADYSSVVREGTFSFNTSMNYPFITRDRMVTSGTAHMPIAEDMNSWLEATFIIGEGEEGTLSWEARNSSWDYYYFLDTAMFTDGTVIIVDGTYRQEYVGESDASSSTFTECPLTFGPGRHTVRFDYQKKSSDIYTDGRDCFMLSALALNIKGASIDHVGIDEDYGNGATYYTVDGHRHTKTVRGINIVKRGNTVSKIIVK